MNDSQRIDALNTLITQWEGIGWLKEIMQNVPKVREEVAQLDSRLQTLKHEYTAQQAEMGKLDQQYKAKEVKLQAELEAYRKKLEKEQATWEEQYLAAEAEHKAKLEALAVQEKEAQAQLDFRNEAIATANDKLVAASAAMEEITKKREALKASLS